MPRTYAKFPEVESERTTQDKPCQHYGTVVVVEMQKIIFNYFYSDSRKVPRIEADVLTPVSSTPLVYSSCIQRGTFLVD